MAYMTVVLSHSLAGLPSVEFIPCLFITAELAQSMM